jgi:hypothetical protein
MSVFILLWLTILYLSPEGMPIYGCLGIISLLAGNYLIVITERDKICTIKGKDIYKVTKTQIVQIPVDLSQLIEEEVCIR